MPKTTTPYEFLARWDDTGKFKAAHGQFLDTITDDATGEILAQRIGPAIPVGKLAGFPLDDILAQLHTDALARVVALEAELVTTKADAKREVDAANAEVVATKADAQREVDAAKAEATAAKNAQAEAEALFARLTDFLAKVKEAFNAGDLATVKTILAPEIIKAEQTEKERRIAELEKLAQEIADRLAAERASIAAAEK